MDNKVAIYCRLSEEDRNKKNKEDDSGSIQNQKMMLTEYAIKQNWSIYDIYSDDDYAGSDRNRPEFNRMIKDAKAKKFNIILCKTQSRFTRELEIVESYIHSLFPLLGIRFVSIVDNIDTDVIGNKKTRQINGLINEWYLEDMSDSIKAALHTRMKAGYFIGSFAPYGYKKDPQNKGHLIPDENVADVIREIFKLYNSGIGRSQIAKILNNRGIPSPSEYYKLNNIKRDGNAKRNGKYWKYYTVSHILENEVYIGNLVQGKTHNPTYKSKHTIPSPPDKWIKIEGAHEPLIDKETWDLTRKLWRSRSKPCYNTEHTNAFSGFLICSKCGYKMCTAYNKHKRYFRCGCAKYGKICCDGTTIFESTLEKCILKEIQLLKKKYLDEEYVYDNVDFVDNNKKYYNHLIIQIKTLERKLEETNLALKNLYVDRLKGIITLSQFTDLSNQFDKEKNTLLIQIQNTQDDINRISQYMESEEEKKEKIKTILSFNSITRELLNHFIDHIEIGGNRKKRQIDIFWKF